VLTNRATTRSYNWYPEYTTAAAQMSLVTFCAQTHDLSRYALPFVHRFRISALFCAVALLFCELVSRPYANIGICDDGPYILVTQKLAATGHIVFNGWSGPC
jgi:hypothetical protein